MPGYVRIYGTLFIYFSIRHYLKIILRQQLVVVVSSIVTSEFASVNEDFPWRTDCLATYNLRYLIPSQNLQIPVMFVRNSSFS